MKDNIKINGDVYGIGVVKGGTVNQNLILPEHKTPSQLTSKLGKDTIIGRVKELEEIDTLLKESSSLLLINGIGGIGKSTIASYYLHSQKENLDYYGFFEGLESFIFELREPLALQEKKEDDALMEALSQLRKLEGDKLLVFDDIKDIKENQDKIEKILALKNSGYKILLTSREEIEDVEQYYLDVLSLTDAKELFNSIYKVEDEVLLEEILGYLDCHAFFVEMTAKTLKSKKTLTPEIIKEKFKNGEFSTIKRKRKESFNDYLNELFSFDKLDDEEILVLKQFSALPSIVIILKFLVKALDRYNDKEEFEEILNYLVEKGWLNYIEDGYKLHQIIKEYILLNYKPSFNEIEVIVDTFNEDIQAIANHFSITIFEEAILFFESLLKTLILLNYKELKMVNFLVNLSALYFHNGNYEKNEKYLFEALTINQEISDETNLTTAMIYRNLAIVYRNINQFEKIEKFQLLSFNIAKKVLKEKSPELIEFYDALAEMYSTQGEYDKAEKLFLEALSYIDENDVEYNKYYAHYELQKASLYQNLAGLYESMQKYLLSEKFYKKSININKKVFSEENIKLSVTYNDLGYLYIQLDRYKEAKLFLKKALKIREEKLNPNHPNIAQTCQNLMVLYYFLNDIQRAKFYANKAYTILEKNLPVDDFTLIDVKMFLNILENGKDVSSVKIGRNDPCPCNSGKKYKKCCGKNN